MLLRRNPHRMKCSRNEVLVYKVLTIADRSVRRQQDPPYMRERGTGIETSTESRVVAYNVAGLGDNAQRDLQRGERSSGSRRRTPC